MDGHYKLYANGKSGSVEKKEMSMNIYIKSVSFYSGNFDIWKLCLDSILCHSHLLPTERCEPVPISKDSCFVLPEINIYYKLSTIRWLSVRLNSFLVFCRFRLKILSQANSLIANNNIRSVILEIKTTDEKLLKY